MTFLLLSFHIEDNGVEGLSKLFVSPENRRDFLEDLKTKTSAREVFYLATCNRAEFLFVGTGIKSKQVGSLFPVHLKARMFRGLKSVSQHLLETALSMDSVVFGENQIMGQIKDSIGLLQMDQVVGPIITCLINTILNEAKQLRTRHGLSSCPDSVPMVAVKLLQEFFKKQTGNILLVGAGQTHHIVAKALVKRGMKNIIWTNRTRARAETAAQIAGSVLDWGDFRAGQVPTVSAICCATDAGEVIISQDILAQSGARLIVDLGVPANANRQWVLDQKASYVGMDEIREQLKLEQHRSELIMAKLRKDVLRSIGRIQKEVRLQIAGPVLAHSVRSSEEIFNEAVLEGLYQMNIAFEPDQLDAVKKWSRKLVKRITHSHLTTLKSLITGPLDHD